MAALASFTTMLKVGLGELRKTQRVQIDTRIAGDDLFWGGAFPVFEGPVLVRLEAQLAGADVLVRGNLEAVAVLQCRRCLTPVRHELDEALTFVFQQGVSTGEAEDREVYVLPPGARELDLGDPLREQLLLAVPAYVVCRPSCKGMCPRCGIDLNEGECECSGPAPDERWAALRAVRLD